MHISLIITLIMAQHSHSVYGNLYPAHNYYQKNKSSISHNHNNGNININNQQNLQGIKSRERMPVLSALPFSNRNGKLHRSNPHLHFGGSSNENQIHYHQNHNKVSHGQPLGSKWKHDITNAASNLPRKWCDFVFRRNVDNKVYRSESFRFIQKTNSLLLLPPLSAGLNKYRNKKLQVPVSEDYVEPLDHVVRTGSKEGLNKSTSVKAGLVGAPVEDDDTPYNEIIESYNAPYYYSDTIKQEPTYCSPCPSWRQSCGDLSIKDKSSSLLSEEDRERLNYQQRKSSRSSRFRNRSGSSSSGTPMARKRYETAFIPSSSHHPSQSTSPDVDSLLLAIESSCSLVRKSNEGKHDQREFGKAHIQDGDRVDRNSSRNNNLNVNNRKDDREENWSMDDGTERGRPQLIDSSSRIRPDPSISYCQSMNHSHSITHTSGSTTTTNSSPLSDKKSKPTMPLSEPLPQKRYSNITSSSSSSSGPSTSTSLTSCRPSDKRLLMTMMKDNSVSSLESIDSTKSEDLQYSRHFVGHPKGGSHYGHFGRQVTNCKLLSPISDKSPLEPMSMNQSSLDGNEVHGSSSASHHHHHHYHHHQENHWPNYQHHLMSTAELTNVPWDMPKLKRRLALLADSGISLDCPGGYPQSDGGGNFTTGSDRESCEDSSHLHQYTTCSHIRGNLDLRITQPPGDSVDSLEGNNKHPHNLHLSFDNGLVQDEYYEDPRLDVNEPTGTAYSNQTDPQPRSNSQVINSSCSTSGGGGSRPKSLSNRVTNVTSVQVHVSGNGGQEPGAGKPDRCRMKLDFRGGGNNPLNKYEIDPTIELEAQEWFHGAITRSEAESILRATKEGSFLVRNCESSSFNRYSLSLKSARGFIHIRIEPNSLGTFSLGEQEFPSVSHLVLHFMNHRLPIKGAEHVKLLYPVITQLL